MNVVILCFSILVICGASASNVPEVVFSWNQVYFDWPTVEAEEGAIIRGEYIPENNLPLGLARWRDKLFITVPRWKRGVAAALNYIDLKTSTNNNNQSPLLMPYPSWEANTLPRTKAGEAPRDNLIVSPFRLEVDVCDRLWIIDTGADDIFDNQVQITPPTIQIYDLKTDQLIRKYTLKASDMNGNSSFFANIRVDVPPDNCKKAFAYLTDLGGNGLVVYSLEENDSWRISHHYFHFDPLMGNLTVEGINFQWNDGLFGIALGAPFENGERTVYFHALASTREFSVSNKVLQNRTTATDTNNYNLFRYEGNKGPDTQSMVSVYDEFTDVIFFTQANKDGVACWKTSYDLNPLNFALVAQDHERLLFVNDIVIDADRYLWILSDRMPRFLLGNLNPNQINFRILKIQVDEAIKNTPCE